MAGKSLATLVRLAKWTVDEKRRVLQACQAHEEEILQAIRDAEAQLLRERAVAGADSTGVGFAYGAFARAWLDRRAELEAQLEMARDAVARASDQLAEAFGVLKTYEITQRERDRRDQLERDRKDQIFLDEVGAIQHRRKGEAGPG